LQFELQTRSGPEPGHRPIRKRLDLTDRSGTLEPVRTRPKIADVAKLCGVTPATVSRVLNFKEGFRASDALREKIIETATKLGYAPDLAARNLNRSETRIIGLFANPRTHLAGGINQSLLDGLDDVLHVSGYDVFLDLSSMNNARRALPFWRFDGAIILQMPKPETVTALDRRRVPYVCVNERVGNPIAYVLSDDAMGMTHALDHLKQLGHKRICYANTRASYFNHYSVTERYETLLTGCKDRGIKLVEGHETPFNSASDFLRSAIMQNNATAVISYDHDIAVTLVGASSTMGLRIPEDFSLICFNDVFPVARMAPPLTAVSLSGNEMGRIGADLLLNFMLAPQGGTGRVIRVPESLVVRASTGRPGGL
jgi:DNA-binding LacI/PurR family transcriptional regulator